MLAGDSWNLERSSASSRIFESQTLAIPLWSARSFTPHDAQAYSVESRETVR